MNPSAYMYIDAVFRRARAIYYCSLSLRTHVANECLREYENVLGREECRAAVTKLCYDCPMGALQYGTTSKTLRAP